MSIQRQIAFAAHSKSLCLFLGSGFSKHLCPDMPNWENLIRRCILRLPKNSRVDLKKIFFSSKKRSLPLEDCAEILAEQFEIRGKVLKEEIANIIKKASKGSEEFQSPNTVNFLQTISPLKVITTNYDLLIEKCLKKNSFQSYCPDKSILHESEARRIFHIHGSIEYPSGLVATTRDYYKFINIPNYFSLKTETMLYENTVLIIGYSATDTNLRAILDSYYRKTGGTGSVATIFMLTHTELSAHVSEHLKQAFGIVTHHVRHLDKFFETVMKIYDVDAKLVKDFGKNFIKVLDNRNNFTDEFWENSSSMGLILHAAQRNGIKLGNLKFSEILNVGLTQKRKLASQTGAWVQYNHLAQWLIDLGSWCDLVGTAIEDTYLKSVQFSLAHSGQGAMGYSWQAFSVWKSSWMRIRSKNREMLRLKIKRDNLLPEVEKIF